MRAKWIAVKPDFLVHVNVLARLFRGKLLGMLMRRTRPAD